MRRRGLLAIISRTVYRLNEWGLGAENPQRNLWFTLPPPSSGPLEDRSPFMLRRSRQLSFMRLCSDGLLLLLPHRLHLLALWRLPKRHNSREFEWLLLHLVAYPG